MKPERFPPAEALRAISRKLGGLARSTERDFMAVGGKLESILTRAGEAVAALAGLSEAVSGEGGQALAGALDEVAVWAGRTEGLDCAPLLADLVPVVRAVGAPLRELQRAVRTLRVLGVVTRVETARLGSQSAGFQALAGEVGDLAAGAEEKAEAILATVEVLCKLLDQTRQTAVEQESRQQADLLRLVEECSAGLRELGARRERVREDSRGVESGYRNLMTRVGGVVLEVQIHDSTRQRVEHVQQALIRLAGDFTSRAGAMEASPGVALQSAQLREAREAFLAAVGKIKTELEAIGETFAGLAWTARELAGAAPGVTAHFDRDLERHAAGIEQAVAEWVASRRALGEAAGEVDRACASMSGFVAEIESVGQRMLRLALNAQIQAVHLAASGVVMEALAEGIREVSQKASASAAAAGGSLREVETAAGRISAVVGAAGKEGGRVSAMASGACRLAAEVGSRSGEGRRVLRSLADSGEALAGEIQALRRGIVADRVLDEVTAECLKALEEIAAAARPAAGSPALERRFAVRHTEGSYTMHAERDVHDAFTGAGALPAVAVPPMPASEFGANVELF